MPNDPEWSRYARHLAGEGTPADAEQTRRWIAEDAERARAADEARSTWHATAPAVDAAVARRAAVDTDDAWARLAGRLSAAPSAPASSITVRRRWMLPLGAGLAAAAAAALVVVPRLREQSGAPAWRTYATPAGQRASVYLPDGSRADLRANTTLRAAIGRGAGSGPRVVELTGEAIFTVVHDSARPFRVLAGPSVTEDVGTVFAVRAYAGDSAVRVVVAEGAVSVARRATAGQGASRGAALAAGDVATLDARDPAGAVTVTHVDDPRAYLAWSRDRLVFRNERLAAVVADLGRAFDARIVVADPALAERRVTLDMPTRTLAATLETLSALLGVEARPAGDSVILAMPRTAAPR